MGNFTFKKIVSDYSWKQNQNSRQLCACIPQCPRLPAADSLVFWLGLGAHCQPLPLQLAFTSGSLENSPWVTAEGSFWEFLSPVTDRKRREYESPAILAMVERHSQSRVPWGSGGAALWDILPVIDPFPGFLASSPSLLPSVCPGALPG